MTKLNNNKDNVTTIKNVIAQVNRGQFINPYDYNPVGESSNDLEATVRESDIVSGILDEYLTQINWQKDQGHLTVIEYHKATSFLDQRFTRDFRDDVAEFYKNEINRLCKHYWSTDSGEWLPFGNIKTHEYGLINIHKDNYEIKWLKTGQPSIKWKVGGKCFKEIDSFDNNKFESYIHVAEQVSGMQQDEAVDYIKAQGQLVKGLSGKTLNTWANDFYNQIIESKATIDRASLLDTRQRQNEWSDTDRECANELLHSFGIKSNSEIFSELLPFRLKESFNRITSLIALYQLLLGSETLQSDSYSGSESLADVVCWKKNKQTTRRTSLVL